LVSRCGASAHFANFQSPLSEEGHARTHTFHLLFMCVVLFVVVESSVLFANRRPFAFFFFFFLSFDAGSFFVARRTK
jgi:hypothetical protein